MVRNIHDIPGNEPIDLTQDVTGTLSGINVNYSETDHNQLLNYDADEHRKINDGGTGADELWSADKLDTTFSGINVSTGNYIQDVWIGKTKKQKTGGTYTTMGQFIFSGTDNIDEPTAIKASYFGDSGFSNGGIKIFDFTNSLEIANVTGLSSTVDTIVDLGTLSNVPTGLSIFEVQIDPGSGDKDMTIEAVQVQY